jgi:hypothetical protein
MALLSDLTLVTWSTRDFIATGVRMLNPLWRDQVHRQQKAPALRPRLGPVSFGVISVLAACRLV